MPDREFIHSSDDVRRGLDAAAALGLKILHDAPQPRPEPEWIDPRATATFDRGTFLLFRPEWVFGPLQFGQIEKGHNTGKFFLSPRVNLSPITLYFQGEARMEERRRLGNATISYHPEWLDIARRATVPSPAAVKTDFESLARTLLSRETLLAGAHRYYLGKAVLELPDLSGTLPPFDFIPWPPEVTRTHKRLR